MEAYKGLITLALQRKLIEYASKKPAGDIDVYSNPKAVYAKRAWKANELVLVPATRQVLARKISEPCPANAIDLGPRLGARWADQGLERAFALYRVKSTESSTDKFSAPFWSIAHATENEKHNMIIVEEGVRISVNNEHHTVVIPVAKNKTNIKVDEQLLFAYEAPKKRESDKNEKAGPSKRRKS